MRDANELARAAGYADARAKSEYWRLCVACLLVSLMNANSVLLSVVFARSGYDLNHIGLLLSCFALPVVVMTMMSGPIMARIGALRTARLALLLLIAGFVSLYWTRGDFLASFGSRLVQGTGQGLFLASVATYAQSRLSPTRFLYRFGVFASMIPLAQAIAPPIGGYVLNTWGADPLFLASAVPALIGVATTFGLRPLPSAGKTRERSFFAGMRRDKWIPVAIVFVNGSLWGFTQSYLSAAMEAKAIPLAAFFTFSTSAMFTSRFTAMSRLEAVDARVLVSSGLALMSTGFVLVAMAIQSWPVAIGGIVFGMGYSMVYPVLSAWISQGLEPSARSGPQAILTTSFNLGIFGTPYPMTFVVKHFGYTTALHGLAAFGFTTALGLVALIWCDRNR
jgi:MFS family permease